MFWIQKRIVAFRGHEAIRMSACRGHCTSPLILSMQCLLARKAWVYCFCYNICSIGSFSLGSHQVPDEFVQLLQLLHLQIYIWSSHWLAADISSSLRWLPNFEKHAGWLFIHIQSHQGWYARLCEDEIVFEQIFFHQKRTSRYVHKSIWFVTMAPQNRVTRFRILGWSLCYDLTTQPITMLPIPSAPGFKKTAS